MPASWPATILTPCSHSWRAGGAKVGSAAMMPGRSATIVQSTYTPARAISSARWGSNSLRPAAETKEAWAM